jgi:NadR type nicotinamide-nucleotide adenylyltransferase
VIETALSETDETVVLIYDAPETTPIPSAVRSGWIRALYPRAEVVEAWDGPTEVGYAPQVMRAHERYVIDRLGLTGVTHFYSSEPYGEHMSRALGAVDRRADEARRRIPVSARDIRRDPYAFREYVDPLVYRDLVVNVVFLGAPSTGKTTLARRLAEVYGTAWMPEYGREYWERNQVGRRLRPEQLVEIAEGHLEREDEALLRADRYLFTDTNALTTATFARWYHGSVPARLAELASRAVARYDLTFVCDSDIPYDDTWDRSGDADRTAFQRQVLQDLARHKVPFILLRGSLEERVARVRDVLSRFEKWANPLDLGFTDETR